MSSGVPGLKRIVQREVLFPPYVPISPHAFPRVRTPACTAHVISALLQLASAHTEHHACKLNSVLVVSGRVHKAKEIRLYFAYKTYFAFQDYAFTAWLSQARSPSLQVQWNTVLCTSPVKTSCIFHTWTTRRASKCSSGCYWDDSLWYGKTTSSHDWGCMRENKQQSLSDYDRHRWGCYVNSCAVGWGTKQ